MQNTDLLIIVTSIRNNSFKQLKSACSYRLVFLDSKTNFIYSITKYHHQEIIKTSYKYYTEHYLSLRQEPYLIDDYKFFIIDDSDLPF